MKVVDLFSGTGSATEPWARAGHHVIRYEIEEGHDVRAATVEPGCTFIWASPPCTEYSTAARGNTERRPDLELWKIALGFIQRSRPKYWVIENVVGAQRFWGRAPYHYGAWYLWGWFPPLTLRSIAPRKMAHRSALERARVPCELAEALYDTIITDMTIRRLR